MARTLVLDTITEPSNSGTANITLSSDTTTTMPKVDINGGAIDATTLGAATPSSVAATTLSASGNATVGGTLGVTSNTTVGGTLGVTSNTTVGGTLGITGLATVGGTLGVTGNTALSGSANTVGTVTAGTINEAVIMTGVPRKTLIYHIVHGSGTYQTSSGNSHKHATHNSVSLSAISGKTYLIVADIQCHAWDDSGTNVNQYIALWRKSSAVTRGTTATGAGNTEFGADMVSRTNSGHGDVNWVSNGVTLMGAFTASTTQTEYLHITIQNSNNTMQCQMYMGGTSDTDHKTGAIMVIQEFDSDNLAYTS